MKKISVSSENPYDIIIGRNLNIKGYIKEKFKTKDILLITDQNLNKIYPDFFAFDRYIIESGEKSKDISVYYDIINYLASKAFTRDALLIAFGGGVVGDITGFVASTYMRGISFIQVPTSLLSMVDSSVGGKTGINTEQGKNLIGSFYNPKAVFVDMQFLDSLPEREFKNGLAEIIKTSLIGSQDLYENLKEGNIKESLIEIIEKSIGVKKFIVERDEKERGLRRLLNFGHTFGHGIEKLSSYEIKHGEAVAMGMNMVTRASYKKSLTSKKVYQSVMDILSKYSFRSNISFDEDDLYEVILRDKKNVHDHINLVYLEDIGLARILKLEKENIRGFIKIALKD